MGGPRGPRNTTIRRSLLGNLVALVALTGGTILAASWISGERTVEDLSKLLIEPTVQRTAAELDRFFGEVRAETLIGRGWADADALDPTDHEAMNTLFVPVLEQHPQLSSMMVANSDGVEYLLLRDALDPDTWHNRVVRADEWGTRVFNRRWNTATGEHEEGFGELDYDPRRRIWYEEALVTTDEEPVFWTKPVIFFVTKDPGITASTHLRSSDGDTTTVVAFDLLLLDISRFTSQLEVSESGRAFVLVERAGDERLQVVGLPRDERYANDAALREALIYVPPSAAVADSDARLPVVEELGMPAIQDSIAAWTAAGRPAQPFGYESEGRAWLAGIGAYPLGSNTFWIGVTLPERDLLGGVRLQRAALLAVVLLVLVVGVVRAVTLARRFSTPVEALVHETERMSRGDLEPGAALVSNVREFQRLGEAQDGMREGLKARMKLDKIERDLDIARDIQRGLMPDEVPDTPGFEVQGWSQPADQTGGDYFDWMELPNGRTLITLADVTGHGIGPALIVSVCRAYMRAAAIDVDVALANAVSKVNDLLHADIPVGRFVTAAIGVLDPAANEMALISAGQAPLLYYHAATGEIENWSADQMPLGIAAGIPFDAARRLAFEPGDALILTTDGFFEWANAEGEQWGIERLEAFVRSHAADPPSEFIEGLHAAVVAHAAGEVQPDDLTVVVVKRSG
jgi:serine phosphatase RsbU (regulator of sigma subunit)